MMSLFRRSLIFRVGLLVFLTEFLVLTAMGLYYTGRFSSEVNERLKEQALAPARLIGSQLLKYNSIADKAIMTDLVGTEFLDGMIIGADGKVYYAYHPTQIGTSVVVSGGMETKLFEKRSNESVLMFGKDGQGNYLATLSPIRAFAGAEPFFFVYVKVDTAGIDRQKKEIHTQFIIGSASCILITTVLIIIFVQLVIIKPLSDLESGADNIASGHLDTSMSLAAEDEIGKLGNSLSRMKIALNNRIDSLKELNGRMEAKERQMQAIFHALPDLLFIVDWHGTYLDIVTNNESLLYKTMETLIGQRMQDIMPHDKAELFLAYVRKCVSTKHVQTLEYQLEVLDGIHWFDARISHIEGEGIHGRALILSRDITERKTMEDRLRMARDEAESANVRLRELDALKSDLVSSVSHELRTPLTSILGFSKLVLKSFESKFWPLANSDQLKTKGSQIIENLRIVEFEGERLTRLLNDVLDLNKIESGHMEWNNEDFDPADTIRRSLDFASGSLDTSGTVALDVHIENDLPIMRMDKDRLQQVLLNVIGNAIKYTKEGIITISASTSRQGHLEVRVTDTGPGIVPGEEELIFDSFHQVGRRDSSGNKPEGTGLGLAICKQIVEHYNGRIWVESVFGEGSTFIFRIPGKHALVQ